jgi:hypothetical protein
MSELLRYTLPDGRRIIVESAISVVPGPASGGPQKIKDATEGFLESLKSIQEGVAEAFAGFQQKTRPDSLKMTVGIKFTAEAGAIIAKSSAEASLQVELTWTRDIKSEKHD